MPLRPGFALGLGGLLAISKTSRSTLTRNGRPWSLVDVKDDPVRFMVMAGPFVDLYPSSTLGWHVQALVGYTRLTYAQITQNPFFDASPSGIGLMAGVGDDWWLNDEWSIGLLARITYANTRLARTPFADGVGSVSQHNVLFLPSLEVSFTHH